MTNFARLETTVACAGATKVEVIPELKKMGFASIINLRQPTEAGADIDAEAVAARAAGMRYFSIPFDGPAAADRFLDAITTGAASRRSFTAPTAIVRPQCG